MRQDLMMTLMVKKPRKNDIGFPKPIGPGER